MSAITSLFVRKVVAVAGDAVDREALLPASLDNKVFFANPNKASRPFVEPSVARNPTIFLSDEALGAMHVPQTVPQDIRRVQTRIFTRFKTGL